LSIVLAGLGLVRPGYMRDDAARTVYIKCFVREVVGRGVVMSWRRGGKSLREVRGKTMRERDSPGKETIESSGQAQRQRQGTAEIQGKKREKGAAAAAKMRLDDVKEEGRERREQRRRKRKEEKRGEDNTNASQVI
jgi:hypothetical protein